MTDSFNNIEPRDLEEIPIPKVQAPVPESMNPVDKIPKPDADVKLDLKDAGPIIESQLEETLVDVLKGGWTFGKTIGLILTILSIIALLILNRC